LNRSAVDPIVNADLQHIIADGKARHFHAKILRAQASDQQACGGTDLHHLNLPRLSDGRHGVAGFIALHGADALMIDENL
jgi:hypothetical protein